MSALTREFIAGLELKVLSIERTRAGRWWNFKNVISPFCRLWLVLGGRGAVRHDGRKYILKPGCLHLVPPFTAHDCACAEHLDHYHLHFTVRLSTGVDLFSMLDCPFQLSADSDTRRHFQRLEALYPDRKLPCFDPDREEYRRFASAVERSSHELSAADWMESNGILTLILAAFLRDAQLREGVHSRVAQRFLAVQSYINSNLGEPILLADLARAASLHPTYFSDRFLKVVGERPLEYLMRCRMERAQYLLLTRPISVKETAYEVGFPDPAYFTRAFTRFWRVSPTRYRSEHLYLNRFGNRFEMARRIGKRD